MDRAPVLDSESSCDENEGDKGRDLKNALKAVDEHKHSKKTRARARQTKRAKKAAKASERERRELIAEWRQLRSQQGAIAVDQLRQQIAALPEPPKDAELTQLREQLDALVPQGKAVTATANNIAEFESRRAELQKEADAQRSAAQTRAEKVNALSLTIAANAGEEGKLFGSVTVRDIADAATDAGVEIDRSEVRLPEGPLRALGEYQVEVYLHPEVSAQVTVMIEAEEAFPS